MKVCRQCNKQLTGTWNKKFCGRSCAATYNNKAHPKRSREKKDWPKCRTCENKVKSRSGVFCQHCLDNKKHYHGAGPIEFQTIEVATRRTGSNRYDIIRYHARNLYKKILLNPLCEKCGYTKHVEICHIKAVSTFPKETLVSEVNSRNNILFLCPNCHWEHDHPSYSFDHQTES